MKTMAYNVSIMAPLNYIYISAIPATNATIIEHNDCMSLSRKPKETILTHCVQGQSSKMHTWYCLTHFHTIKKY